MQMGSQQHTKDMPKKPTLRSNEEQSPLLQREGEVGGETRKRNFLPLLV